MKELHNTISEWIEKDKSFAIARVIKTWGSSPRPVSSSMIVNADQEMAGSVSGGCVEGAVVKAAQQVIANGEAKRLDYGVSDEDAWSVGLSCGGKIQVFAQRFPAFEGSELWNIMQQRLGSNEPFVWISTVEDGKNANALWTPQDWVIGDQMPDAALKLAKNYYSQRTHRVEEIDGKDYFFHVFPRQELLLIIGAAHITADLIAFGKMFDMRTVVIDPRGAFAEKTQFPSPPDEIITAYPSEVLNNYPLDAYTYAVILSHDPKIDDNALEVLLPSDVAYIGALGSKKTHAKRTARLLEKGVTQESIDRIAAPIGLSINAKTPREIALSIISQIVEVKNVFV